MKSRRRRPPIPAPPQHPAPIDVGTLIFHPDPIAVDHLHRTWHPPLPITALPYLTASQAVTDAVGAELLKRYVGWEMLSLPSSLTVLLRAAAQALTQQSTADQAHLRTAVHDQLLGLETRVAQGRQVLGQEIASIREAFREWAESIGTQPTALWRAWTPSVSHPSLPGEPLPEEVERWRMRLQAHWDVATMMHALRGKERP